MCAGSVTGCLLTAKITSERSSRQTLEVENILQLVEVAMISSRGISTQLGIPQRRVMNTLHGAGLIYVHTYLQPAGYASHVEFCRWINNNNRIVSLILFTDEAFTQD